MRSYWSFTLFLIATAACAQAPAPGTAPITAPLSLEDIVARVEQVQVANHQNARSYIATREFDLYKKNQPEPSSKVIAEVQYQPPCTKKYEIRQATGSGQGERVVRHILDSEAEMMKKADESDITRKNYEFRLLGQDDLLGTPVYVLQLHPKRDDKRLIDGTAWVDARSFQIVRIEGKLSKNPSWWVKEVHVRIDYGTESGQWMQKETTAVAQVRFLGPHTLISRPLNVQTIGQVAMTRRPTLPATVRSRPRRPSPITGTGVGVLVP